MQMVPWKNCGKGDPICSDQETVVWCCPSSWDWTVYIEVETLAEWLVAVETFWTTLRDRLYERTREDHHLARRPSGQMGT